MPKEALCALLLLCGILMGLGGGILFSYKEPRTPPPAANALAYILMTVSILGGLFFGANLLLRLRISLLVSSLFASIALAAICMLWHSCAAGLRSGGARKFFHVLITLASVGLGLLHLTLLCGNSAGAVVPASLVSLLLTGLVWLLYRQIDRSRRKGTLAKSPVMQEVLEFCRTHNAAAIQLFQDRVRIYDRLPNAAYCKGESVTNFSRNDPPAHWKPYLQGEGCCREIIFSALAYPNMDHEQVELCAKGLAAKLPGFKAVYHYATNSVDKGTHYNESRGAYVHTTETTIYVDEWFLFRQEAAKAQSGQDKAKDDLARAIRDSAPKGNTWE